MTDPILGSKFRTPKWGPAGWFFWGAARCQKIISASKSVRLHCMLGRACILLFQADCRSQVRASANWGGPSQRDRFWCRFSAPVLGSSETASFVTRQLVASRFFQNGLLTLQFVCATHQRVVLHQTVMLHQTAQRSRLVGPWPEKRSRFALWRAAARTTLETEAHRAATLCMCIRTSL